MTKQLAMSFSMVELTERQKRKLARGAEHRANVEAKAARRAERAEEIRINTEKNRQAWENRSWVEKNPATVWSVGFFIVMVIGAIFLASQIESPNYCTDVQIEANGVVAREHVGKGGRSIQVWKYFDQGPRCLVR